MDIAGMSMQMSSVKLAQQTNVAVMKLAMDAVSGAQNNMLEMLMGSDAMLSEAMPVDELASGGQLDLYV